MKTIIPSQSRATTHAALSHPEAEERERARFWAIDAELRNQLEAYKATHGDSNQTLGRKLGFPDGTAVSKYLNNKMDRDPSDFESKVADLLRMDARMQAIGSGSGEILETSVIRQAANFFDTVRRAGAVGVLHSPAGLGKTTAIAAYVKANPTAVPICANAAQSDAKGVRQLLWGAVDHRSYDPCSSRWDYLVSKFAGTQRLLIVDNAQRLAGSGRDCLFDFRDQTGIPMVLVGNPSILQRVALNDQQFSRTLMEHEATLKTPAQVARAIVDLHTDRGEEIYDLAERVVRVRGGGYLRSLVMTLLAMREMEQLAGGDIRKSFEAALAKSIHHKN